MKHLKIYEELYDEPNIGDYVICKLNIVNSILDNFYQTTIGKIVSAIRISPTKRLYRVEYENTPDKNGTKQFPHRREFATDEILHYSKNREDLEAILDAKKYNL
jgi:hypothetical protein